MSTTLYSSHHCPFCARTESTLLYAKIELNIKMVDFNALPPELLQIKIDASIPFLAFETGEYLDESWDIMQWALKQHDPDNWLGIENKHFSETDMLIETYDYSFYNDYKSYRDADDKLDHRETCEEYLEELNDMLKQQTYLLADHITVADIAITPFIFLLAKIEPQWFQQLPYPSLLSWLKTMSQKPCFSDVLKTL